MGDPGRIGIELEIFRDRRGKHLGEIGDGRSFGTRPNDRVRTRAFDR
jgi:hypothetical protein